MKRAIPLAWLQLSREKSRLLVAIAGIAFADFLMFVQLGFQSALYDSATRFHQSLQADLVLFSPQAQNLSRMASFPRRRLYQVMSFDGVESAEALYINFLNWKNPENRRETAILFLGFDPTKSMLNLPGVPENLQKIKLPDVMLFDRGSQGEYTETLAALEDGTILTTEVGKKQVTIEGLFTLGASFAADANGIVSDTTFLRLFPDHDLSAISLGVVKIKPGVDRKQIATALQSSLPDDVKVMTLEDFIQFEKAYWAQTTPIGFIFGLGTVIGFVVGVVIVYQILYSDVSDHIPEYATLKAMGYKDGYFFMVVFQEALILAVLGFMPGTVLSMGIYQLAKGATLLPIAMTVSRAVLVLGLTMIMCTFSGAIAVRKISSADPADIF